MPDTSDQPSTIVTPSNDPDTKAGPESEPESETESQSGNEQGSNFIDVKPKGKQSKKSYMNLNLY